MTTNNKRVLPKSGPSTASAKLTSTDLIGTVARLPSGGPLMTVKGTVESSDGTVRKIACCWFDSEGMFHEAEFNPACLIQRG